MYAATLLIVALLIDRRQTGLRLRFQLSAFPPDWSQLHELFRIGWPPALERAWLTWVFSTFMSILCARLGATLLAVHHVVLDLDAFVYMIPLGVSYSTATRVGQSAGRRSVIQVASHPWAGIILAGSLVGVGDIRTALIVNAVWYWMLGIPLSYWLTFHADLGVVGLCPGARWQL